MTLLKLKIDNFYMFKNFELDLTYARKLKHYASRNDTLKYNKNINVKKNIIIMGNNASGKTTFSKILCGILNYIIDKDITDEKLSLHKAIYNKSKEASYEAEFVVSQNGTKDEYAILFQSFFNTDGLFKENVYCYKISTTDTLSSMRDKLYNKNSLVYSIKESKQNNNIEKFVAYGFRSFLQKENNNVFSLIKNDIAFSFSFSNFNDSSDLTNIKSTNIDLLRKILPAIDSSIVDIKILKDSNNKTSDTYHICFKNKEEFPVPNGNIKEITYERLSHGTMEAILFSHILANTRNYKDGIIFIDEKLSHAHFELEKYLIMKLIHTDNRSFQFFYTTHNINCLDLNLPNNCFLFFRRDEEGYNEVAYPEKMINKNDRKIRNYFENNFFETLPDFSTLDEVF